MHPYLRAAIAAGVLLSAVSSAAVTGEWQVNLKKGSTNQAPVATGKTLDEAVAACQARIPDAASAKTTYQCHNLRYVAVVTTDPVPPPPPPPPPPEECQPLPSPTTRTQTCPDGKIGSWQQTLTQSTPPACTTAWLPVDPPVGACTDPPPPPPPTGDVIRNGQAFTVTGSNFGSKPSAAPLAFDDFESGAAGAPVPGKNAVVGRWLSNDYCTGITYGTQDGHKVAKHTFAGGTYNASLCVDPAPTQTVYLDFWAKGVPRSNPSRNWKVWRFYSASDADVGNLVYYCRGGGVELGSWVWLPEVPPPLGWVHYEVIQRPGGSRHYRNSKLDSSSSSAPSVAQIRIGHYWGLDGVPDCGSNQGGDVYTDDVYVDNSVARVVLANAATFDGSTKRQVQRATAWGGAAVTVVGNTRGFAAGETAYILVMDAANVQRQALKVTVQ